MASTHRRHSVTLFSSSEPRKTSPRQGFPIPRDSQFRCPASLASRSNRSGRYAVDLPACPPGGRTSSPRLPTHPSRRGRGCGRIPWLLRTVCMKGHSNEHSPSRGNPPIPTTPRSCRRSPDRPGHRPASRPSCTNHPSHPDHPDRGCGQVPLSPRIDLHDLSLGLMFPVPRKSPHPAQPSLRYA